MKSASSGMIALLGQPYQPLTTLVKIERTDGVSLFFTAWDEEIIYDGDIYIPAISMDPSAIKTNSDLTTDQMDFLGAIDEYYIKKEDIRGGRYDYAVVTILRVNPFDLSLGEIKEMVGTIGDIEYGEKAFTVPINSIGQKCSQQFGRVVAGSCSVNQLGDYECKVNLLDYQFSRTIASITNQRTLVFNDTHDTGYYEYGLVRFKSIADGGGKNYNINMEVKIHTKVGSTAVIILQEAMPFPLTVGDAVILEAGCDRRGVTCRTKFNNLPNFHGFLYVPDNNYLLTTGRPPG